MKSVYPNVLLRFVSVLLFASILSLTTHAQYQIVKVTDNAMSSNSHGYLEALPDDYAANPTKKYPLLIVNLGINSHGTGSAADLEKVIPPGGGYPQNHIRDIGDFPSSFTVNGVTYKFIIIVPQFMTDYNVRHPSASEFNEVLNYMIAKYRVDTTRIYLTGNSAGGGPVWDYPGAGSMYANRIAAIAPFSAVTFPTLEKALKIKNAKVAVWAFHNTDDSGVPPFLTTDFVKLVNQDPPPAIPAKYTGIPGTGHDSWYGPYTPSWRENGSGPTLYEWFLMQRRVTTTANAGEDQDLFLPTNSTTLQASGSGPNGSTTGIQWTKVSGPSTYTLSSTTSANPTLTGLVYGYYVFAVTITDDAGGTSTDQVAITVLPRKYEGEAFNSQTGTTPIVATTDNGAPASAVQLDAVGESVTFSVDVPATTTYTIRVRSSSDHFPSGGTWPTGGSTLTLASGGSDIANIFVPYSGTLTNYGTMIKDVNLTRGVQNLTLRMTSAGNTNINWIELVPVATDLAFLPVKFSQFNVNCADGSVNLNWKTASEINTKSFAVEKSNNGRDWTTIATLAAEGRPAVEQSYQFRDNGNNSNALYRVTSTDFDGKKTQTSILRSPCSGNVSFSVYPNPVTDKAVVDLALDKATNLRLTVLDSRGAVVQQQSNNLPKGNNQVTLYLNSLPKGSYTLNAQWDNENKSVKLIKN